MSDELTNEPMTPDQILADMERLEKEADASLVETKTDVPSATSSPRVQDDKGEAPAESEDAAKGEDAEAGAEPEIKTYKDEQGRLRDATTHQFIKGEKDAEAAGDSPPPDTAAKSQDGKPESKYEKAKKVQERQKGLLSDFEKNKATWRAERDAEEARLKARADEIEREAARLRTQTRPVDKDGRPIYSSEEYRNAAKDYRAKAFKGEDDPSGVGYDVLSERAERAAEEAWRRENDERAQLFEAEKTRLAIEVMKESPEVADINSPIAKEIQSVFAEELERARQHQRQSIFSMVPDGFRLATEVAKLRMQASRADTFEKQLEEARAEIDRLNGLTQLSPSSPTERRPPRALEEMDDDEALAEMDRRAAAQGVKVYPR
jgi:hypothetical protein